MTTAEKISALFDDDGTIFETDDGRNMADVCEAEGAAVETDEERWRYEFPDGSALTGNSACWDIEGTTPFSMAGSPW